MSKRICLYCRHFHYEKNVYDGLKEVMRGVYVPKTKTIEAHCDKHPDKYEDWWAKNWLLPTNDAEEMDCFEFTEGGKKLNDIIELSKDILKDIKKED